MIGSALWDDRDRAVFRATAERGEHGGGREEWADYVAHVFATVPKKSERERKLNAAAMICAEIRFTGQLIREAGENRSKAAEALEMAERVQRTAGADAERARKARLEVTAARKVVRQREGYLLAMQAVRRNLANGDLLAAFVNVSNPPLLYTPWQAEAKVNGRPYSYDEDLAAGRAEALWREDDSLTATAVIEILMDEYPDEFGEHGPALRRLLKTVRERMRRWR